MDRTTSHPAPARPAPLTVEESRLTGTLTPDGPALAEEILRVSGFDALVAELADRLTHASSLEDLTAAVKQAGAQLWADNCTRCHYVRPPDYYSAAQWQLVMHHMRSRANLTGGEERKIVQFLKAGSGAEE